MESGIRNPSPRLRNPVTKSTYSLASWHGSQETRNLPQVSVALTLGVYENRVGKEVLRRGCERREALFTFEFIQSWPGDEGNRVTSWFFSDVLVAELLWNVEGVRWDWNADDALGRHSWVFRVGARTGSGCWDW